MFLQQRYASQLCVYLFAFYTLYSCLNAGLILVHVLQCLCQTNLLWSVLKDEKDNEGKMRNILPYGGDVELSEDEILKIEVPRMSKMLTTTLDLLDKVYNQDSSSAKMTRTRTQRKNTAINPGELFNEICAK